MTACPIKLLSFRGQVVSYEVNGTDYTAKLFHDGDQLAMTEELRQAIDEDIVKQAKKLKHDASDA